MKESLKSIIHAGIRLLRFRLRHATLLMWGILLCPDIYGSPYVWKTSVSHLSTEVYEPFCLPSAQTARALDMQPRSSWAASWYSHMGNATTTTIHAQSLFAPTKRASAIRAPFETIRYRRIGILSSSSSSDYSEEEAAYCYAVFQSNLTMVGATEVAAMASVTSGASPIQKISRRQASDEWLTEDPGNGGNQSNASPVGEPLVLLLFAIGLAVYRHKKARRTSAMENQSKQNQSHGKRIYSPLTKSLSFILTPLFGWMPSPPPAPLPSPSSKREAGEQKEHQSHKIRHSFSKSKQHTL